MTLLNAQEIDRKRAVSAVRQVAQKARPQPSGAYARVMKENADLRRRVETLEAKVRQFDKGSKDAEWRDAWAKVEAEEDAQKSARENILAGRTLVRLQCPCAHSSGTAAIEKRGSVRCYHCRESFTDAAEFDAHKVAHHPELSADG